MRVTTQVQPQTRVEHGAPASHIVGEGIRGLVGPQGPPGPAGPAGATEGTYVHTQGVADTTWTIPHDLGFYPNVIAFSSGDEVEGDVTQVSVAVMTIEFAYAISGVAYLS